MNFNHQPGSPARLGPTNPGTLERNGETLTYVARPQDPTAQAQQRVSAITSRQEYRIGLQQPLQFNAQAYSVHPSVLGQFQYQPLSYGFGRPRNAYPQAAQQYQSPIRPTPSTEPFAQFVQAPGGSTGVGGAFGRLPDPNPTVPDVSRFGFTSPLHRVTPVTPPGPPVVDWARNPYGVMSPPSVYVDQFGQPLRVITGAPVPSGSTNQGMNFGSPNASPSTSTNTGTSFGPNAQSSSPSSTVSSTPSQLQTRQKELRAELTRGQAELKASEADLKALRDSIQKIQTEIENLQKQEKEREQKQKESSAAIAREIREVLEKAAKTGDSTGVPDLISALDARNTAELQEQAKFIQNIQKQIVARQQAYKLLGEQATRQQGQIKTVIQQNEKINQELTKIQGSVKSAQNR